LEIFSGNKSKRSGIHAIAEPCWSRSIGKEMPQMTIGMQAANLGTGSKKLAIFMLCDIFRI
jgi:hypothetical protein